jgi:methylmalonyl-CoA/ethylmalonyl-CoA epimerase
VQLPLDHVAIAVESIASSQPLFESLLGAAGSPVEHIASQGVSVVFIGSGAGRVELIEPEAADTPVGRFLARRGPGLHHIAYRVADIDAALARFAADGFDLIDKSARRGAHGKRVAFLHPRSTGGVLVELVSG